MLLFDEFIKEVSDLISDKYLDENYSVYERNVVKNNHTTHKALQIVRDGDNISPSIYMEEFYEMYSDGGSIDDIADSVYQYYTSNKNGLSVDVDELTDYDKMCDKIILRLVNYEKNKEILERCPYVMWNDLAITFRWIADFKSVGIATALLTNREFKRYDISLEELYYKAVENMQKLFPMCIDEMEELYIKSIDNELIREKVKKEFEEMGKPGFPMLVLSNEQKINGATSVLYPHCLKKLSEQYEGGFYILPSSVHELILIPDSVDIPKKELKDMVKYANTTCVREDEMLSYNVYCYDAGLDEVSVI